MNSSTKDPDASPLRSLMAEAAGEKHVSYANLADAKLDRNGIAVFEGDWGGQIYLIVRASLVRCDEIQLHTLLAELDDLEWAEPDGAGLHFESREIGTHVAGGMGGGAVTPEFWLHPRLVAHEADVREVLNGARSSIHPGAI
jgi:hypothetical protein